MKLVVNPRYQDDPTLTALLQRLPEAFAAGEGELIYDSRNKLRRFRLPSGLTIVVKAYKHPNAFQQLCYSTFWPNKAQKSYTFGLRLLSLGIDTPEPIAYLTYHNAWGAVSRYYFVSTEDNRPDCRILRDGNMADPQPLIDALAGYLIELHQKGFLHGDTNLSNFLYHQEADGTYRFAVIDTNRSRFLDRPASQAEALANLERLTHVRDLLCSITRSYAHQRGWDADAAQATVLALIAHRERQKARLRKLKK